MRLVRFTEIDGFDRVDFLVKLAKGRESLAERGKDARNMQHVSVSVCR
jgi:hypothetical protein